MKKYIIFIFGCCIGVLVVFLGMMLGGIFDISPSEKEIKKVFSEDYSKLVSIVNYMKELNVGNTYILLDDEFILSIDNNDVVDTLNQMKKDGYTQINKCGDTISFVRWSKLDFGSGFAYSPDKKFADLQFLTHIVKLPMTEWYYYEENFNKWKMSSQQ